MPTKFKGEAPRVEETPQGRLCEGKAWPFGKYGTREGSHLRAFLRAGLAEEPEPWVFRPTTPKYRLIDMDRDRIEAQVLYVPPLPLRFEDRNCAWLAYKRTILGLPSFALWRRIASSALAYCRCLTLQPRSRNFNGWLKRALKGAQFGVFEAVKPVFHAGSYTSGLELCMAIARIGMVASLLCTAPKSTSINAVAGASLPTA